MAEIPHERFQRAVARVGPVVDEALGEFAATYALAALQRRDAAPTVTWTIENEPIVQFEHREPGPSVVRVYDISLLAQLRKRLRSKRLRIEHALAGPE